MNRFISLVMLIALHAWGNPDLVKGKTYRIDASSSVGTLTFYSDGTAGKLNFDDGVNAVVSDVVIGQDENEFGLSISFVRTGEFRQVYTGTLSTDGRVINGNFVNRNQKIPSNKKFPFFCILQNTVDKMQPNPTSRAGTPPGVSEEKLPSDRYYQLVDSVFSLDKNTVSLDELLYIKKQLETVSDTAERKMFYRLIASGLLSHNKKGAYQKHFADKLPNRSEFETECYTCDTCRGSGKGSPKNCSTCGGRGSCRKTGCRGGTVRGPVVMGRSLSTRCYGCKGSGRCTRCNGTGQRKTNCRVCKGKKLVENPASAGRVFADTLTALTESLRFKAVQDSLVIVSGTRLSGSGFIAKINGKAYIVTNSHVIRGNGNISFKKISGRTVEYSSILVSTERDIALAVVKNPGKHRYLDVMEVENTIGQSCFVPGNSGGVGIVTFIRGDILGVGPKLVETNAPFVHGNSGSPVIVGNKVAGVATGAVLTTVDWVNYGTRFSKIRRLATRIDNLDITKLNRLMGNP